MTATDAAGNTSAASSTASVTTGACSSCTTTTLNPLADAYVNQASSGTNRRRSKGVPAFGERFRARLAEPDVSD